MNKQELRKQFLEKRKAAPCEERLLWPRKIENHVIHLVTERRYETVFLYVAFRNEPETESIIRRLLLMGKTVAVPKCGANGEMTMHKITSFSDLSPGAYGIFEPSNNAPVSPDAADLVLVPGCAFGRDMTRLGYGGGYYDRFLLKCTKACKVGVCFSISVTETLPVGEFDVKMDCVLTENGLVNKL